MCVWLNASTVQACDLKWIYAVCFTSTIPVCMPIQFHLFYLSSVLPLRRIYIDTIVSTPHSLLYHNRLAAFAGDAYYAVAILQTVIYFMAVGTTNASRTQYAPVLMCQLPRSPLIRSFFILQELRHAQTLLPTQGASVSSTCFGAAASFPRSIRIPSIRLSLREATDDSPCRRPDISYRIDSCFHLRFIGLQCLDDVPGDTLNDQIFRAYLFTGINSFVPVEENRFLILGVNAAIHLQCALIVP